MTKRTFFRTLGAGVSAVRLLAGQAVPIASPSSAKFTAIDCSRHFNASAKDIGPRDRAVELGGSNREGLLRSPSGAQTLRGIPFALAAEGAAGKSWLVVSELVPRVEVPINAKANFVCLAQFCDWDPNELSPTSVDATEAVGQLLAEVVITHQDGTESRSPVRRRFEVNSLTYPFGRECFAAVPHRQWVAAGLNDPVSNAMHWGEIQTTIQPATVNRGPGTLWLCSIANPHPEQPIRSLRLESKAREFLAVAGITLFHGREDPLRHNALTLFQFALPEGQSGTAWEMSIDLGLVARSYQLPVFDSDAWLRSPVIGLGEARFPIKQNILYAEITASPEATLTLRNRTTGAEEHFAIGEIVARQHKSSGVRVEVLEREKTWIRGRVLDETTNQTTPVRLAFRSKDGRYIPPYGHRSEVNGAWFQDYGADLRSGQSSFAYVDGNFQVELPVGDVFLEMTKGFEYEPVRRKLNISADQRELDLSIGRFEDMRGANWVNADSHVHFLSPSTAILEAQAEGLNLINLLSAQWGDLFSNVGDLSHGHLSSRDGDTLVAMGTENRQHLLGHLSLLGAQSDPAFPMSADGPPEGYLGQPLWNALADWADSCRSQKGLVVSPHFPYPTAEIAADIILGKIDAVELQPRLMGEHFHSQRFMEWYRYLNCGYRLPALGGTDKMTASVAAGAFRGYVHMGEDEFSFENWAKAVRRGNTFMTSGPLLRFEADGRVPGGEIEMRVGEGRIEVQARVRSTVPVHRLEIVANGHVVASTESSGGARELLLNDAVPVSAPGWIAARCSSRTVFGGIQVAAHTSPVYITSAGHELFSPSVASYLLTLLEGSETWVDKLAIRPDADRLDRVRAVFTNAREKLHQRMHHHGIPH